MVKVVAQNFLKPGEQEAVRPLYLELVEETNKENGCVGYQVYVDAKDDTHLVFVEEWETREALDAHMNSPHFTRLVPQIRAHCTRDSDILILKAY